MSMKRQLIANDPSAALAAAFSGCRQRNRAAAAAAAGYAPVPEDPGGAPIPCVIVVVLQAITGWNAERSGATGHAVRETMSAIVGNAPECAVAAVAPSPWTVADFAAIAAVALERAADTADSAREASVVAPGRAVASAG